MRHFTRWRRSHAAPAVAAFLMAACSVAPVAPDVTLPPGASVVENVRVVDLTGDAVRVMQNAQVVVAEGRILSVTSDPTSQLPDDVTRIDGAGMTALPGLYDMHVHVWDENALAAYLAHGVTTVRNLSGMPFHLDLQARIDAGHLTGPRLLTTGPILNGQGPNTQINHEIVETADDARAAVRRQHAQGFRHLKVYSNLSAQAYDAIREESDTLGMTLTGHTPEGRRDVGIPFDKPFHIAFEDVLDHGFVTIEHIESVVWHGLKDSRDADHARELARKIADSGIPVTTTLLAHHNLLRVAATKGEAAQRPGTDLLNPFIRQMEQASIQQWASRPTPWLAQSDAFFGQVAAIFAEEGVVLVAGSDAGIFTNIPGYSLIEETGLMVQGGMTPFQALKAATFNPAVALGETDRHGSIAPGRAADMVLYACDPLADIACLETPAGVMRAGEWHDRAALETMKEIARQQDPARTQENVLAGLVAQGADLAALGLQ